MKPDQPILELLKARGPLTGSAIATALDLMPGDMYPALLRLEKSGIVSSEWANTPSPRARIYRITEGRQ